MKFLIINGPNLNMLGIREPHFYGSENYSALCKTIKEACESLDIEYEIYQSNHEGSIVDKIQDAYSLFDGIVINPAAYTHTSIAILDALKSVRLPAAEVHISDVTKREAFRQISYAGMACQVHVIGQGIAGYVMAAKQLKEQIEGQG